MYLVVPPSTALARYANALWYFEHEFERDARVEVFPKATPFITVCLNEVPQVCFDDDPPEVSAHFSLNGLVSNSAVSLALHGKMSLIGVELAPYGLHRLTGEDASRFTNNHVDLGAIIPPREVSAVLRGLPELRQPMAVLREIDLFLAKRFSAADAFADSSSLHTTRQALALMVAPTPRASVSQIARDVGVSTRTLERKFNQAVGIPPRSWMARRLLGQLRAGAAAGRYRTVEHCARELGFHDAAHLYRFTRAQCDKTPGELLRAGAGIAERMLHVGAAASNPFE